MDAPPEHGLQWHPSAHSLHFFKIYVEYPDIWLYVFPCLQIFLAFQFRLDISPRTYYERVPVTRPLLVMPTDLCRGNDVTLIINRAGLEQSVPVGAAGVDGEGRGEEEDLTVLW